MDLQIVNFHYVEDETYPQNGIVPVRSQEFRSIIEVLVREREPVSLSELNAFMQGKLELPRKSCFITFDDGLRCQWEVAVPILDSLHVPAAFFVCSEHLYSNQLLDVHKLHVVRSRETSINILRQMELWIDDDRIMKSVDRLVAESMQYRYDDHESRRLKFLVNFVLPLEERKRLIDDLYRSVEGPKVADFYMAVGEWRALAERGALGAHSHAHRPLAALAPAELEADLRMNVELIEARSGCRPRAISYPYGGAESVSRETAEIASRSGFTLGLTMGRKPVTEDTYSLLLPRYDVRDCFPQEVA